MEERETPETRGFDVVVEEATATVKENLEAGVELIDDLSQNPLRPITDTEDAVLTIELASRMKRLEDARIQESNAKTSHERQVAQDNIALAQDAVYESVLIDEQAGTANARGLNARRIALREDFTLANMVKNRVRANNKKKLTPAQFKATEEKQKEIQGVTDELDAVEEARIDASAERAIKGLKTKKKKVKTKAEILAKARKDAGLDAKTKFTAERKDNTLPTKGVLEDLARLHIDEGTDTLVQLVDGIKQDLADIYPDLTERDIKVILSGYGRVSIPNQESGEKTLRDLKQQARLATAIEDAMEGEVPKKTGQQRDKMSDKARGLMRELQNLLKMNGIEMRTKDERMATALDSAKTRLKNQITDLNRQIKTGERDAKKKGINYDQEATELKAERDRLKAVIEKIDGKYGMTPEQRIRNAGSVLDKTIAEISKRIEEGDLSPTARNQSSPWSPALSKKRNDAKILRDALKDMRKEADKPKLSGEMKALAQLHKRLEKNIATHEERIKNKDFDKKTRTEIEYDEKADELRFKLEAVKHEWQEMMFQDRLDNMSTSERASHEVINLFNAIKSLVTSFDLSGLGRQGGWYMATHPIRTARLIPTILNVARSAKYDFKINEELKKRSNARDYKKYRVGITETGSTAAVWQKDEEYAFQKSIAGNAVKRIPGMEASQRAYVTTLNIIRADYYDMLKEKLGDIKGEKLNDKELQAIATFVRDSTGRAGLGKHENASLTLATIFFSPRFVMSRFRIIIGSNLVEGPAAVRKAVAKEYARYAVVMGTIMGLATAASGDDPPEFDPRSSAFGKIKFGDTYVDLFSGLQQPLVFLSRLATGQRKTRHGTIRQERGEDASFGASTLTTINQFIRSKLAPMPGATLNLITGKDYIGDEKKAWEIMADLPVPLVLKDTIEAMRVEGVTAGVAMGFLAVLGSGISTQQGRPEKALRSLGANVTSGEKRKQLGVALRSLENNMSRGKLDIKREHKGNPDKIREQTRKLLEKQRTRRRQLRDLFLGNEI